MLPSDTKGEMVKIAAACRRTSWSREGNCRAIAPSLQKRRPDRQIKARCEGNWMTKSRSRLPPLTRSERRKSSPIWIRNEVSVSIRRLFMRQFQTATASSTGWENSIRCGVPIIGHWHMQSLFRCFFLPAKPSLLLAPLGQCSAISTSSGTLRRRSLSPIDEIFICKDTQKLRCDSWRRRASSGILTDCLFENSFRGQTSGI